MKCVLGIVLEEMKVHRRLFSGNEEIEFDSHAPDQDIPDQPVCFHLGWTLHIKKLPGLEPPKILFQPEHLQVAKQLTFILHPVQSFLYMRALSASHLYY